MSDRTFRVVGVSFADGYPERLLHLNEAMTEGGFDPKRGEGPSVVLRRNPKNEYDTNAIEVHIPSTGEGMVGHLSGNDARRLAPMMDSGDWEFIAWVDGVTITDSQPDRPGLDVTIRRQATAWHTI